ncbi:YbjN domain-containing protein [Planosporangium thailandense]|uniref:YbjN domain-containing protein n=1 Tax=Planosporangium thailandense TaxID=765197 RepID=A0ABX0XSC9_9ACTN|nr:YbjN domain-containing protein [Planosporangium thailandense]NJC68726.1 YbjN domain-containing protein [Planosporangium thailandense]
MTAEPTDATAPLPAEGLLLDVEDTSAGADLKAKVREAWQDFARALAIAFPQLAPGTVLDITLDPTASGTGDAVYEVRVTAGESGALTAAAVGNALLPEGYRLDRAAIGALVALGWSPPGVLDASRDFFGLRLPASDSGRLAVIVSRTLRDVYGAPHPAFLTYAASDADGTAVPVPALGAARPLAVDEPGDLSDEAATDRALARFGEDLVRLPLADQVAAVVATLLKTTPDALSVDPDGDIGIRAGSAMVFVRVRDNPPLIDVFSPVLTEVEPTERLYVKLSELTNRMPIGRLYCTNDTVWASVPVFGRDFQPTHLMLAVQVMTGLADELDDRLHGEFGGKRFFGEGDKPAIRRGDAENTGMYL